MISLSHLTKISIVGGFFLSIAANAATRIDSHTTIKPAFHIDKIKVSGEGCPDATVGGLIAADGTSFTLIYDEFFVEMFAKEWQHNVLQGLNRVAAACQLKIYLDVPDNYQFKLRSVDYRGHADLDQDVAMVIESRTGFDDDDLELWHAAALSGQRQEGFLLRASPIDEDHIAASQCGGRQKLYVETTFALQRSLCTKGGGLIIMDSLDGLLTSAENEATGGRKVVAQRFAVDWQRCD